MFFESAHTELTFMFINLFLFINFFYFSFIFIYFLYFPGWVGWAFNGACALLDPLTYYVYGMLYVMLCYNMLMCLLSMPCCSLLTYMAKIPCRILAYRTQHSDYINTHNISINCVRIETTFQGWSIHNFSLSEFCILHLVSFTLSNLTVKLGALQSLDSCD